MVESKHNIMLNSSGRQRDDSIDHLKQLYTDINEVVKLLLQYYYNYSKQT